MKRYIFVMLLLVPFAVHGSEWAHNAIHHTLDYGDGSGVRVGVFDGAARCSHQELAGHCTNYDAPGYEGSGYWSNHATHVADTIAGVDKAPGWRQHDGGVAPKAHIGSYQVFHEPYPGASFWITDENEAAMVDLAASHGVSVINMSYGAYDDWGVPYLSAEMLELWRKHGNITFVNASGNESVVMDPGNVKNIDNVIFVGASNQNGALAWWSNTPGNHYKDQFIVAPGDFIVGAFGQSDADYGHMSGTSMAAPIVTGAVALLHSYWGHLKNNPQATASILFESATDLGAPGVDAVYGHGLLNIEKAFNPAAIGGPGDDPGDGGSDPGDDCDDVIIIDDPVVYPPGDVWYDSRGNRHLSHGIPRNGFRDCVVDNPPVVDDPPSDCEFCDAGSIGTPGDGVWYDSMGDRYYYAYERNGERRVLERAKASRVIIKAASKLSMVFFDKFGRDYKTNAVNYKSVGSVTTEYLNLSENLSLQMVSGDEPNFKMKLSDGVAVGRGRTLGFESNPVLDMLDDGAFIIKDKIGIMYSDTSTTALYKPEDWLTFTYTKENGYLGSTGMGKYDTIASTVSKDYGMFFGSTTMALSTGGDDNGMVRMSSTIPALAFNVGAKGSLKKNLDWSFTVGQSLQPVDGTMSVSYDNRHGRNLVKSVDLNDDRDTTLMFRLSYKW